MDIVNRHAELKAASSGSIVLMRVGDFYEAFNGDAEVVAKTIGLTLTTRGAKGSGDKTPMAGFPYHALDGYLQKLVAAGHRVAVAENWH